MTRQNKIVSTLELIQYGAVVCTIALTQEEWEQIGLIDYIDLDDSESTLSENAIAFFEMTNTTPNAWRDVDEQDCKILNLTELRELAGYCSEDEFYEVSTDIG